MVGNDNLRTVLIGVRKFTDEELRGLALEITAALVEETPRDTGWARNNWIPAIGVRAPRVDTPTDRSKRASGIQEAVGRRQQGSLEVATQYRMSQGPIFISNPVPYIVSLNDGHSQQAPAGFVQRAIDHEVSRRSKRRAQ